MNKFILLVASVGLLWNIEAANAKDCNSLDAAAFGTWHVLSDISSGVDVSNYKPGVSSFEMGSVFRNDIGRRYLMPGVEPLMRTTAGSALAEAYQVAMQKLRSINGGIGWYRKNVSDDIRRWAIKKDSPTYQGDDVIEQSFGDRTSVYNLQDGTRIFLTEASRREPTDKWALRYRPGDF